MPKSLMGKFQDSREDPKQVYRQLKVALVDEPEKVDHERILKLLKRYRDALPETMEMNTARKYLNLRITEIVQMSNKDNYTKQELLRIAATCLSPEDASDADMKMNRQNRELKEYAESKIQQAVLKNLRKTTTKPEDMWISNPLHRKRQFVHACVTQNKPLPKVMIKNDFTVQRGRGRGSYSHRGNRQQRQFGGQASQKQESNEFNRSRGRGRGRGRGGRGGRAPRAAQAAPGKENVGPSSESKITKVKPYDMTKIPERLDHFGDVCDEIHQQLQDQLISRCIEIDN